jgi:hypothetical protein
MLFVCGGKTTLFLGEVGSDPGGMIVMTGTAERFAGSNVLASLIINSWFSISSVSV